MANIGYCRVSTTDQKLDMQLDALNKYGCEKIYRDEGISGYSQDRPGLEACVSNLQRGDVLVVYKLDRLGRSLEHVMRLTKEFEERGVEFKSISEGFDTTTPAGKVLFHIIGALAQFERDLIRERVIAGMEAAKKRGTKLGRRFTITPEQTTEAIKLHNTGLSFGAIGERIGVSRGSAHRIVRQHLKIANA